MRVRQFWDQAIELHSKLIYFSLSSLPSSKEQRVTGLYSECLSPELLPVQTKQIQCSEYDSLGLYSQTMHISYLQRPERR